MHTRFAFVLIAVATAAVLFAGCPIMGSTVVGAWAYSLDEGCDTAAVTQYLVALYADGSAEFFATQRYQGTWELNGSVLTVDFPNLSSSHYVLSGTLGTDSVTNGTLTIDSVDSGCISALRAVK